MSGVKIACAQYPIGYFEGLDGYAAHIDRWVAEAANAGARLLLFPEYGGMELASLLPEALQGDLAGQIAALQDFLPALRRLHGETARRHGVMLVTGSLPVRIDIGGQMVFVNRAHVYDPQGHESWQDKRQMTRFERESWIIQPGAGLKVFETGLGFRFGISICYDIEFPLPARALAEAGADLVLAPSCTDTLAGMHRVHVGARARALESQIYVAVAQTVGEAAWSPAVDVNIGRAAVYAAPDRGFPDDGILAAGDVNRPGWVYAAPDFAALAEARLAAQVYTRADWPLQFKPDLAVTAAAFQPLP